MYYVMNSVWNECEEVVLGSQLFTTKLTEHLAGSRVSWPHGTVTFEYHSRKKMAIAEHVYMFTPNAPVVSPELKAVVEPVIDGSEVEWIEAELILTRESHLYELQTEPYQSLALAPRPRISAHKLWIMHVLNIIDAVDIAQSQLVKNTRGKVVSARRLVLLKDRADGLAVFRLGNGLAEQQPIVSESFMRAVQRSGLPGFEWCPISTSS
jgi:hypothetical protein